MLLYLKVRSKKSYITLYQGKKQDVNVTSFERSVYLSSTLSIKKGAAAATAIPEGETVMNFQFNFNVGDNVVKIAQLVFVLIVIL